MNDFGFATQTRKKSLLDGSAAVLFVCSQIENNHVNNIETIYVPANPIYFRITANDNHQAELPKSGKFLTLGYVG